MKPGAQRRRPRAIWDFYVDKKLNPGTFCLTMTILPNGDVPLSRLFDGEIINGARYTIACGDEKTAERLRSEAKAL